jgi:hypothetical protein
MRCETDKERGKSMRAEILQALGMHCVQCGWGPEAKDWDHRCLEIDHVFNDGAIERKALGTSRKYYEFIAEGIKKGRYQLLCARCNKLKKYRVMDNPDQRTKVCTRCKESKLMTEFWGDVSQKDGRDRYCRVCKRTVSEGNLETFL